ncbi:MAG: hypothetical protein EU547_05610 [Promethearchaeota archaeon]|nr:MAG: hypothetical protein EU547_05610 [Candidatus Lokiarchaeota archaeon]
MAGIFAVFKRKQIKESIKEKLKECAYKIKHRGPIKTVNFERFPIYLVFHQKIRNVYENHPFNLYLDEAKGRFIAIDGHIYNIDDIAHDYYESSEISENGHHDLKVILDAYKKIESEIFKKTIGTFSGVMYDGKELIGFKDNVGAKPLYYCNTNDFFVLSSELKALTPLGSYIRPIAPGHVITSKIMLKKFYKYPRFITNYNLSRRMVKKIALKLNSLVKIAVLDNIKPDEHINVLLSGGIDSTIITHNAKEVIDNLHAYTVGVKGSRDVEYAKKFAKLNDLEHTILNISLNDMLRILPEVIYALETYDAALIRSSIPMFMISQKIKIEKNPEVILTGEGGDELFGGYEYLQNYQSHISFNDELKNLLQIEHKTGLQRVDRIPYHFSIEARAPLFDSRLVAYSFKIPPELKIFRKENYGIVEKWILRKAFENEIPAEFIWRKKQKFSDGAGSQFLIRNYLEDKISDEEFEAEKKISPNIILRSKEELYYWRIFESKFNPHEDTLSELGTTKIYEI